MRVVGSTGRIALVAAAPLLFFAYFGAFTTVASAEGDPLAREKTELSLRGGLMHALTRRGVSVHGIGPVRVDGSLVTAPVAGGELDPTTGKGEVAHRGGIVFKRDRRRILLRALVLDTAKGDLTAMVSGKRMAIASIRGFSFARQGVGVTVFGRKLMLTGKAARRLDVTLGLSLFRAHRRLASSSTATQPLSVKVVPLRGSPHPGLRSGFHLFSPDSSAVAKFEAKGIVYPDFSCREACKVGSLRPIAPAFYGPGLPFPSLAFYITGGRVALDGSTGGFTMAGGVTIKASDPSNPATIAFDEIWLDLETKEATAELELRIGAAPAAALGRVPIMDLDLERAGVGAQYGGQLGANAGGVARLGQAAATVLNQVFPGPPGSDFVAGDSLGKFSVNAEIR